MDIPRDLLRLTTLFASQGWSLYLVGGAVRDAVLGKEPKDWDVATDATPDQVVKLLRGSEYHVVPVGVAFGVVRVKTSEGNEYEVATFREDGGYSDGRRPDQVSFSTIENDVLRRDLTINALFYDLVRGEVVDYVGGLEDLRSGTIRAVGDPEERFGEDRLRILRVLRFAARFGGNIDSKTLAAIRRDPSLQTVSPERIRDEFLKGLKSATDLGSFIRMFSDLGLWNEVFPGLRVDATALPSGGSPLVVLAALLRGNSPDRIRSLMNSLKYLGAEASGVAFLVEVGNNLSSETAYRLWKLWKSQARSVSSEDLVAYHQATGLPKDRKVLEAWLKFQPGISARDLMDQGLQGKELGQEIERLETERFRTEFLGEAMALGGGGVVGQPLKNLLLRADDDDPSSPSSVP